MSPSLSTSFTVADSVVETKVGVETVLLELDEGVYHGLDEIGTIVWECLKRDLSIEEISTRLVSQFEVDEQEATRDVQDLVDQLIENRLIIDRQSDGASV